MELSNEVIYKSHTVPIYAHVTAAVWESFTDHCKKTVLIYKRLRDKQSSLFESLIKSVIIDFKMKLSPKDIHHYLEMVVKYHDLGKYNIKFQKERLNNPIQSEFPTNILTYHSLSGAFLFYNYLVQNNLGQEVNYHPVLGYFAYIIAGHHTRLLDPTNDPSGDGMLQTDTLEKYKQTIYHVFEVLNLRFPNNNEQNQLKLHHKQMVNCLEITESDAFPMLVRLFYAVFTMADIEASKRSPWTVDRIKSQLNGLKLPGHRISDNLKKLMINSYQLIQSKFAENRSDINQIRFKMYQEALVALQTGLSEGKRIFFLKMPTGGGKTNTSLGLALEILNQTSCDRVIYALPFINLIDQNFEVLENYFGISDGNEARKVYSNSLPSENNDFTIREIQSKDRLFDYPVLTTTMVRLFDIIAGERKTSLLQFQQLANSVVILDEIQSLPLKYWPTIAYLLTQLAQHLNTHFILMSATFPKLDTIVIENKVIMSADIVLSLISNTAQYFSQFVRNKIVSHTIEEFSLPDELKKLMEFLQQIVDTQSKDGYDCGLFVFNTVRTSRMIYEQLVKIYDKTYNVLLLNSTILSSRRLELIDMIRNRSHPILLVSTQSIEAGIDVDFDYVVRDFATLDSIEQVRGRCNRELRNNKCDNAVYLISTKIGSFHNYEIYNKIRIDATRQFINNGLQYNPEDIDKYYSTLITQVNEDMKIQTKFNQVDNIKNFKKFRIKNPKFTLNILDTITTHQLFICICIDAKIFNQSQLDYIYSNSLNENSKIVGTKVIRHYKELIEDQSQRYFSFTEIKVILSTIVSQFQINVATTIDENVMVKIFGQPINGMYVVAEKHIAEGLYDKITGLDHQKLKLMTTDYFL